MKNQAILTVLAGALTLSAAQAGTQYVSAPAPVQPPARIDVPSICDAFRDNTASVSIYPLGFLPDGGGNLDDALGAGLAVDYFFTSMVGLEVDANWAATDDAIGIFTGSLVVRFPIDSICLAPYVFGGGGIIYDDSDTRGIAHVGAGVDWRINRTVGIFADGRYTWDDNHQNFTLLRTGVRFGF